MRIYGRMWSRYFVEKSVSHPFRCILHAARLFPQKILGTKVLKKTRFTPYVAMMNIKYRADEVTLTKSFSSPIFNSFSPAKLDACSRACAYIINNFMAKLELLVNNALQLDR